MVAPFTDLRDGDAENLLYLVLSGFITRPTLPASLLITAHIASRAGRLLAISKISSHIHIFVSVCSKSYCSDFYKTIHYIRFPSQVLFSVSLSSLVIVYFTCYILIYSGLGSLVGIATEVPAGRSGIESRWGRDFPPVQTGPGAHPASCKMGSGSFPGVEAAVSCC